MITPGQYGVDLWAMEVAILLKQDYPHLKCSIIAAYLNPEDKWKDDKKEYFHQIIKGLDYYASVSKQPYEGPWQLKARDDLLFRKTDGIVLLYDEDAGEGSPKFYKERALRKQQEEDYTYISISSDDIQSIADDERYNE
ncbi:hypothetical protein JCM16418_2587 [Paenibacillus pini JCM 16418]|uniref:Uncharacterized protein n=1 Tax=Paenibacillus pini JCM 16418 TaxID=1236976 RepID=W7YV72_9BACL|nr:hypothetical protein JCM16418_2587 [Paenibacillus pini JCM 16418]